MNRIFLAAVLPLLLSLQATNPELQKYLHIRRSYGIVESVGVPALETLVGTRIFEVEGVVKGTMKAGNRMTVLLERTDGETMSLDATSIPDWAIGSAEDARLIIKATRNEDSNEIQATIISMAKDEDVRPIEAKLVARLGKAAIAKHQKTSSKKFSANPNDFRTEERAPSQDYVVPSDEATPQYAAFIHKHNPRLSARESYRIAEGILGYGRRYGVDARLIVAMVICESDFNPKEVSHAGAMGLGQLMPDTVQDYGITNPFDSVQNLYGTVREIRSHIDKYQNQTGDDYQALVLGLAAYNAGEGAVRRHGGVPPFRETQNYVRKVIKLYHKLAGFR